MATYELPDLPYSYDALEPSIDARIMELHHDKHHQGYVNGANAALDTLEEMRENDEWGDVKGVERNLAFNLSGHINHSVFWENMSPDGGGEPGGDLADALDDQFGSFEEFKTHFSEAAKGVEGSGWGMLLYDHVADIPIVSMAENHQNQSPLATPLLGPRRVGTRVLPPVREQPRRVRGQLLGRRQLGRRGGTLRRSERDVRAEKTPEIGIFCRLIVLYVSEFLLKV